MNDILDYNKKCIYSAFGVYLTIANLLDIKINKLLHEIDHRKLYEIIDISVNDTFMSCYDEMTLPLSIFGLNPFIEFANFSEDYKESMHEYNVKNGKYMLDNILNGSTSLKDLFEKWIVNIENNCYN